jgi:phenylalanyl-tRNA synthetase beta chain
MKIVHSWLNDLVAIGDGQDTDVVASVADVITNLGLAVEDVDRVGGSVAGVITAKVLRTERHPDAAKVHRVFVDAGDGVERHVWCGAFNMAAGDVIPLATPGTVMPDGRAIEPKPILSISSDGMLCSARELGLGDDHSGILILPADTPLGVPYGEALQLGEEVVYDLDVLRNRPDCYGHLGVARDVAAHLGLAVAAAPSAPVAQQPARSASVEIVHGERCPRFTTVVISGVEVGTSPDWMQRRLAAAGMRPINNVVDVSNYVMLETNQPNHAYDFDTLGGGGFRIRLANEGESMVTLDDAERTLTADDLLICDATDRPIGIAGIMGGQNTEISASTTVIALETAWFEPAAIMRSVVRLGLRSEASARFERGVDPLGIERGIARFVELLRLTCPHLVVHDGMVDARTEHLPAPASSRCARSGSAHSSAPSSVRRPSEPSSNPSGSVSRPRATRCPWPCRHGGPTAPRRSTSSKRSLVTTATSAWARRCRRARFPVVSVGCSSVAVGCAKCCSGWVSARRCRTRSSPLTSWSAPVCRPRRCVWPTRWSSVTTCCAPRCAPVC